MVCVTREADIAETFSLSAMVAGAGLVGLFYAICFYPPLKLKSRTVSISLVLFVIAVAILFMLWIYDALTRYSAIARLMIVLAAVALTVPGAYYFLNGLLDVNPPGEFPALISSKYVSEGGENGTFYVLECSLMWNQQTIEQDFDVSPELFSAVQAGDSVSVAIHPGAFSKAWYGKGLLTNGHDAITLGSKSQ